MFRLLRNFFVILFLTIASVSMARATDTVVQVADSEAMATEALRIFTNHSSMDTLVEKLRSLKSTQYPIDKCEWVSTDKIQIIETSKIVVESGSQRKFFANRKFTCENQKISTSLSAIITLRQEFSEEQSKVSLEGLDGLDLNVDDLVHNF
ncbi:MAG: hypothetical protein KC493_06700 [Bacteriovoracaceae bacterium]|nr:hypothetical protein [Bacteriovoracaceae bacterium]